MMFALPTSMPGLLVMLLQMLVWKLTSRVRALFLLMLVACGAPVPAPGVDVGCVDAGSAVPTWCVDFCEPEHPVLFFDAGECECDWRGRP